MSPRQRRAAAAPQPDHNSTLYRSIMTEISPRFPMAKAPTAIEPHVLAEAPEVVPASARSVHRRNWGPYDRVERSLGGAPVTIAHISPRLCKRLKITHFNLLCHLYCRGATPTHGVERVRRNIDHRMQVRRLIPYGRNVTILPGITRGRKLDIVHNGES
jgi:hypothetical protein